MTKRSAHFDEIERLLREALGDYAPPTPERVWKRVEARLPGRRRRFIWWWLSGIGLAAVVLGGLAVQSAKQELPAPTKPQVSAQAMGNESIPSEHASQLEGEQAEHPAVKMFEKSLPGKQVVSVYRAEEASKAEDLARNSPATGLADEQQTSSQPASQTSVNAIEKNRFDLLAMLPLLERSVETSVRPPIFSQAEIPRNKRTGKWSVGVHTAPVLEWQNTTGMNQTSHVPIAEQTKNPATGWQSGISLAYQPSPRWRVETGFWRQTVSHTYSHQATLRLMDGISLNPNGPGAPQYEFGYALESHGNGPTIVTVRLEEIDPSSHIPTDEPFVVTMQTTHRSTEWLVPLTAKRLVGQGRWQGSLRGGAVLGISGSTNVKVEHFDEKCTAWDFPSGYIPAVAYHNRNNLSLRYLFGAGVEYRLAPHWRLAFEPLLTGRKEQTALAANAGLYFDF